MTSIYKISSEGVIWEKIGEQIMIANLESGQYCNIQKNTGTMIWELVTSGISTEELHMLLTQSFKDYDQQAMTQVDEFLSKLVKLNFITLTTHPAAPTRSSSTQSTNPAEYFTVPQLFIYDDIDTLLQLDPIDDHVAELIKEYELETP